MLHLIGRLRLWTASFVRNLYIRKFSESKTAKRKPGELVTRTLFSCPSALAVIATPCISCRCRLNGKGTRAYSGKNYNKNKREGIVYLKLNIVLSLRFMGSATTFKLK